MYLPIEIYENSEVVAFAPGFFASSATPPLMLCAPLNVNVAPETSLDASMSEGFDVPSREESPEEHAMRGELRLEIQRGLGSLPEDQRLAVTLVDLQGLSYEEAADTVGVSLGTLKSRLSRGRFRLRDYLLKRPELLPEEFRLSK